MSNDDIPEQTKRGRSLIVITVGILFLLLIIGAVPRFLNNRRINALADMHDPIRVTVTQITPNTKPISLNLPSSAQAWHYTPIWSRVNGYIVRFLVDIGDVVVLNIFPVNDNYTS